MLNPEIDILELNGNNMDFKYLILGPFVSTLIHEQIKELPVELYNLGNYTDFLRHWLSLLSKTFGALSLEVERNEAPCQAFTMLPLPFCHASRVHTYE